MFGFLKNPLIFSMYFRAWAYIIYLMGIFWGQYCIPFHYRMIYENLGKNCLPSIIFFRISEYIFGELNRQVHINVELNPCLFIITFYLWWTDGWMYGGKVCRPLLSYIFATHIIFTVWYVLLLTVTCMSSVLKAYVDE